jgi:hypothetical protein
VHVSREDAIEVVTLINRLSPDRGRPLLVDMRSAGSASADARAAFGAPHAASRIALLGESPVDRVIANFLTGTPHPHRPTRYFTTEDTAVAWLLQTPPQALIPPETPSCAPAPHEPAPALRRRASPPAR